MKFEEHFLTGGLPGQAVRLYSCGYHRCPPGHSYGPAMRDHALLHFIRSGKGTFRTGGTVYELQAGEGFVLFPNVPGAYRADDEDPWHYQWVGFGGAFPADYLSAAGVSPKQPVLSFADAEPIVRTLESMFEGTAEDSLAGEARGIAELFRLLSFLLEENGRISVGEGALARRDADGLVQQAIRYIRSNYASPLTVSDLAKHVGLERSYFSKRFRERVGRSPRDFLIRYRMEQAVRLLIHTREPIGTIAAAVGFEDPSYFAKAFAQWHRSSPKAFRERHRLSNAATSGRTETEREVPQE